MPTFDPIVIQVRLDGAVRQLKLNEEEARKLNASLKNVTTSARVSSGSMEMASASVDTYEASAGRASSTADRLAASAQRTGGGFGTQRKAGADANRVLIESGRIANDLSVIRFGGLQGALIATANNFEGLIQAGRSFVLTSGGIRAAASGIVGSLLGPAGIAFALQAAATLFITFGNRGEDSLDQIGDAADDARRRVEDLLAALFRASGARAFSQLQEVEGALAGSRDELRAVDREIAARRQRLNEIERARGLRLGSTEAGTDAPLDRRGQEEATRLVRELGALQNDGFQVGNRILRARTEILREQVKLENAARVTRNTEGVNSLGFRIAELQEERGRLAERADRRPAETARLAEINREIETLEARVKEATELGTSGNTGRGRSGASPRRRGTGARGASGDTATREAERQAEAVEQVRRDAQIEAIQDERERELEGVRARAADRIAAVEKNTKAEGAARVEAVSAVRAALAVEEARIESRAREAAAAAAVEEIDQAATVAERRAEIAGASGEEIARLRELAAREALSVVADALGTEGDLYDTLTRRYELALLDRQAAEAKREADARERTRRLAGDRAAIVSDGFDRERRAADDAASAEGASALDRLRLRQRLLQQEQVAAETATARRIALAYELRNVDAEIQNEITRNRIAEEERRLEAAEAFTRRLIDSALDAALTVRRIGEEEVAATEADYAAQAEAVRENLRRRQLDEDEAARQIADIDARLAAFRREVAEDSASVIVRVTLASLDVIRSAALDAIAAELARAAASAVASAVKAIPFPFNIAAAVAAVGSVLALGPVIRGAAGFASGGFIGKEGERGRDTVPVHVPGSPGVVAARGEAILNRHQQVYVNEALRGAYGFDLAGLFSRVSTPHSATADARQRLPSVVSLARAEIGAVGTRFASGGFVGTGGASVRGTDARGITEAITRAITSALAPILDTHARELIRAVEHMERVKQEPSPVIVAGEDARAIADAGAAHRSLATPASRPSRTRIRHT